MRRLGLLLRRARAGAGLLLTILLLAATTTAIIAGTLGYSQAAATTAARAAVSGADPTEAGIRVQTRLAEDPQAQDAAARAAIEGAFAPAPVTVRRSLVSEPRPVAGRDERLVVTAGEALLPGPGFTDLVEVSEGDWPAGAGGQGEVPGALHAGTAAAWGVGVGEVLDVGGTSVRVGALWRPVDPRASFWFGDPLAAGGLADRTAGPLVVHPGDIGSFGATPFTRWAVAPTADELQPEDMARLADAAQTLRSTLKIPAVDVRGVTVEGDLGPTTATAARNLATARALNVVPVVLLLLVSVIAVVQIARLQAAARSAEVEVFVARGASRGQLLAWSAAEAVVVTVLATALGTTAAVLLLRLVPAGAQQVETMVTAGLATGLAVLLALVSVAAVQVRTLADRSATDRSGRGRQATTLAVLLLVPAAAALAWWQLSRTGSPLVGGDGADPGTDLLAGSAPALLLATAAVLALALLGPVSRLVEVLTRRGRRLAGHLAAAQVSRRLVVHAVPVVLTVLALGATTLAASYAATAAHLRDDLRAVGQGAAVRAVLAPAPVASGTLSELPDVAAVPATAALPVWLEQTRVGPTDVELVALPVDRLDEVSVAPEVAVDGPALAAALLGGDDDGRGADGQGADGRDAATVALPDGPTTLTLQVDLTARTDSTWVAETEAALAENEQQLRDDPAGWLGDPGAQVDDETVESLADTIWDSVVGGPMAPGEDGTVPHELTVTLHVTDPGTVGPQTLELAPVAFGVPFGVVDRSLRTGEDTVSTEVEVALPAGSDRTLDAVTVGLEQRGVRYEVDTALRLTDGQGRPVLARELPGWESSLRSGPVSAPEGAAVRPPHSTVALSHDPGAGVLDLSGSTGDDAGDAVEVRLGPAAGQQPVVPVAVTAELAATNALQVGDAAAVNLAGRQLTLRVASVVPAAPGTLSRHAVVADSGLLGAALAAGEGSLPLPDELWFATDDPDAAVTALGGVAGVGEVRGPGSVAVTDAASAVRLVFWVASAGAVLLAVTGTAAVTWTLLRARRPEVAVLRALGASPAVQARSRVAELVGVAVVSGALGLAAGWAVGALVVPGLARATTQPGWVALPARLSLELPLWLALVGVLALALTAVVATVAARVRRQALDAEYREEVR